MGENTVVTRDEHGNWGPTYLEAYSTPMKWPPRLSGALRWLLGYLWPWNAAYLGIAAAAWFFLTPPLDSMRTLEWWWVAAIFARNAGLTVLWFGGMHLYFYMLRGQGADYKYTTKDQPAGGRRRLFGSQVRENVFWSVASGVTIWTAWEAVTWLLYANALLPFAGWASNPVWFIALVLLIPMIREVHFYLVHRLLHWKPLYRLAHYLHHRNVDIGPWSGLSMHPVEHVLYFSGVAVHWVVASHPFHALFHLCHLGFSPAAGHCGYDRIGAEGGRSLDVGAYMHYLHHQYFECNYGGHGLPQLDRWMGTFHDGSPEAHERMTRRLRERWWAKRAAAA